MKLQLTYVDHSVCNHVLGMINSCKGNLLLLRSWRHCKDFLHRHKIIWKDNQTISNHSKCRKKYTKIIQINQLTTSMLHLSGGLLSTSRDCRKVNMEPGEWSQQLTSSRTWTCLEQAAARRAESMTGQNLWQTGLHQNICSSSNKLNRLNFWLLRFQTEESRSDCSWKNGGSLWSLPSPERLRVLSNRQEVHNRDENKFLGVVDHRQDGSEVVCASAGWNLRRGTLVVARNMDQLEKQIHEKLIWYWWFRTDVFRMIVTF